MRELGLYGKIILILILKEQVMDKWM